MMVEIKMKVFKELMRKFPVCALLFLLPTGCGTTVNHAPVENYLGMDTNLVTIPR